MRYGTDEPSIRALVGCQKQACAEEISYPLDMVRLYKDKPICEECYQYDHGEEKDWTELPPITMKHLYG